MSPLFDPLRIRGIELRNRIVFAPVVTNFGLRNQQATQYYVERAKGGVGLIIVHGTPVDLLIKAQWSQSLSSLALAVHEQGAKVVLQLWHGNELNGEKVAPSARESYRQITREEIRTVVEKFATAARHCQEAGFDGVEVHGAHGYFIHQFYSPLTNQRSDEYGGNAEKRMLLGMELVVAMREAMKERGLLLYRHSAVDGAPGGSSVEESARFAKALENHWLDVIDVSAGMGRTDELSIPASSAPEGTHADLAAKIKVGFHAFRVSRIQNPLACQLVEILEFLLINLRQRILFDALGMLCHHVPRLFLEHVFVPFKCSSQIPIRYGAHQLLVAVKHAGHPEPFGRHFQNDIFHQRILCHFWHRLTRVHQILYLEKKLTPEASAGMQERKIFFPEIPFLHKRNSNRVSERQCGRRARGRHYVVGTGLLHSDVEHVISETGNR